MFLLMVEESGILKAPTYSRQRLLLFFLEAAGTAVSKLDLQKLVFLYHQEHAADHYAFVPYRYGCYSFLCADDLDLMEKRGWIEMERNGLKLRREIRNQPWAKGNPERQQVGRWLNRNPSRGDTLVAETYRRFPYYAIHSKIKERLLNADELKRIEAAVPSVDSNARVVYTLGYEGIAFETYLNKLIQNRVEVLCDVRRNPLSRKFGFSSKTLVSVLPKLGIQYVHFPELGIESEKRKELHTEADYNELFAEYRIDLPTRTVGLQRLKQVIDANQRVALTCFEAEPHCCHRHCISDLLRDLHGYRILHL